MISRKILELDYVLMNWRLFLISQLLDKKHVMPRPLPTSQIVTKNDFENCQLAPQITMHFSNILCLRSHAAWKTSQ